MKIDRGVRAAFGAAVLQDETQRDLIFAFTNLRLARMGTGEFGSAKSAFGKGLQAAVRPCRLTVAARAERG
jgi:hypothetical protein